MEHKLVDILETEVPLVSNKVQEITKSPAFLTLFNNAVSAALFNYSKLYTLVMCRSDR
jgi:hypothetical protein